MLEHNDGAAYQAIERGQTLSDELRQLQERYPTIIKDVRGRGLFIGLNSILEERSISVIRAAAYSDSLGYFPYQGIYSKQKNPYCADRQCAQRITDGTIHLYHK